MMTLVFSGGRDYRDVFVVRHILEAYATDNAQIFVGDCPTGLDAIVRHMRPDARVFAADWQTYGRSAGPRRNADMCAAAAAAGNAVLFAFPGGRGTASCVAAARRYGLHIVQLPPR